MEIETSNSVGRLTVASSREKETESELIARRTIDDVQSFHGVVAVVEVYERVVLDLLHSFHGAAATSRLVEDVLQRLLGRRQHQVSHVQDLHLPHGNTIQF